MAIENVMIFGLSLNASGATVPGRTEAERSLCMTAAKELTARPKKTYRIRCEDREIDTGAVECAEIESNPLSNCLR